MERKNQRVIKEGKNDEDVVLDYLENELLKKGGNGGNGDKKETENDSTTSSDEVSSNEVVVPQITQRASVTQTTSGGNNTRVPMTITPTPEFFVSQLKKESPVDKKRKLKIQS